ncbi:FAD-binding oxidoreductase [Legionella sp. PATHC039]|nr:FAD-binding oxidoreductase [Legionella sp. PATHC039]
MGYVKHQREYTALKSAGKRAGNKLKVEHTAPWLPGQYLSLINPEGTIRDYSIANIPSDDGYIELHIKSYLQGKMGQ